MSNKHYAWYMYPEPEGKFYLESELSKSSIVEEIFDYCQINLASIFGKGWEFLFSNYSLEELSEIDKRSGWFQPCSKEEFKESIYYMALVSGYNPETNAFGNYNGNTGTFESKS